MSTVAGLDLSLTRAGIAVLRDGRPALLTDVGHGSVNGKGHTHRSRRITSQCTAILRALDAWFPVLDLAVIEDQLEHGPMLPSALDRSALWWGVFSALTAKRIPVAVVNPNTLKRFATGKGNAQKPQMLAAAREWWPRVANHDQGDSAWLAGMGAVQLGEYPPFALTPWRLEGMKAVKWP